VIVHLAVSDPPPARIDYRTRLRGDAPGKVPGRAPGRDRKVGPAIGGSKDAQIDVGGPAAVVVQEGVGGAGVPVADDELVDRRRGSEETEGMEGSQTGADGPDGRGRIRPPAGADCALAAQGGRDQPGPGFVGAQFHRGRHRRECPGPCQSCRLPVKIEGASGGCPLHEAAVDPGADLEGQPPELVAPDGAQPAAAGERFDGCRHQSLAPRHAGDRRIR
jgi:hypothetical protein